VDSIGTQIFDVIARFLEAGVQITASAWDRDADFDVR